MTIFHGINGNSSLMIYIENVQVSSMYTEQFIWLNIWHHMAAAVLEAFNAMSYIQKKRLIVPLLMDKLIVT